jgi:DNA replication protein DnaC
MILSSNHSFGGWGEVFDDRVIVTVVLDRILHHVSPSVLAGMSPPGPSI